MYIVQLYLMATSQTKFTVCDKCFWVRARCATNALKSIGFVGNHTMSAARNFWAYMTLPSAEAPWSLLKQIGTPLTSATACWVSGEVCATVHLDAWMFRLKSTCGSTHDDYSGLMAKHRNDSRTQRHEAYLIPITVENKTARGIQHRWGQVMWALKLYSRVFYGYDA